VREVTGAASGSSSKVAGDSGRGGRHLLHSIGEVALLIWILGVFWYYYESQGFVDLVLALLGQAR
jgi:hypothetical protein